MENIVQTEWDTLTLANSVSLVLQQDEHFNLNYYIFLTSLKGRKKDKSYIDSYIRFPKAFKLVIQ